MAPNRPQDGGMTSPVRQQVRDSRDAPPVALSERAMDNLRYIRETMERSASFTHVSGVGGMAMGLVALLAAFLASRAATNGAWLTTWLVAAAVSFVISAPLMARKSRAAGVALLS